jgi:protein-S-isoprenylcysteine O-methyltransferase Ste14
MAGALLWLGRNYQLGGSAPRAGDEMVIVGPYRFIRHPMYAAALSISLGLALTLQSLVLLAVFGIYLGLILSIIPFEETRLLQVYREQYPLYQKQVKKLVPYLF